MATDPTTTRTFYDDASRRRSGASNSVNPTEGSGAQGGNSYLQGASVNELTVSRALLPVLGRATTRTVAIYRIDNPALASNRTIFAVEDFKENNYFLETDKLIKSKYTSNIQNIVPTRENISGFILPPGHLVSDSSGELMDIFFDIIKPALDASGFVDYSGEIPIPAEYQRNFEGYDYLLLKTSAKQTLNVVFPDGGIKEIPDLSLNLYVYGNNRDFDPDTPFTELQKYDPIAFVKNNAPLGMFPETSKSPSYSNENIYNGIIEPFNIRDKIYGKEIFANWDRTPGSVSGDSTDPIDFSYSATETTKGAFAMHEDIAIARTGEGYFEEQYVSTTVYRPDAYADRDTYDSVYVDEELENVLISMDTTLDEGNLPVQHIDMTVGFDGVSKDRFGSIVYRGLLR